MVLFSPMVYQNRSRVAAAGLKAGMLTICQGLSFVQAGALLSSEPDRAAVLARVPT